MVPSPNLNQQRILDFRVGTNGPVLLDRDPINWTFMSLERDLTMAEVVSLRPELARPMTALGLDFCCGGGQSLSDGCSAAGLDVDEVLSRFDAVVEEAEPDWANLTPSELVAHIENTHHRYLGETLPYLDGLMKKVTEVHGERHPELADISAVFNTLRADLEPHLMKEERVLFPMIRDLYDTTEVPMFHCGTLQNPIRMMCLEHDTVGELLGQLSALTFNYSPPDDACASYSALFAGLSELEADTHLHVHKENNLLFPVVVAEEAARLGR
jgi:regulator of cell morphogenesis and NO signaling